MEKRNQSVVTVINDFTGNQAARIIRDIGKPKVRQQMPSEYITCAKCGRMFTIFNTNILNIVNKSKICPLCQSGYNKIIKEGPKREIPPKFIKKG